MGIPVPNGEPSPYSWQVGSGLGRGGPHWKGRNRPGLGGGHRDTPSPPHVPGCPEYGAAVGGEGVGGRGPGLPPTWPLCLWHPLEAMGGCQSPSPQGEKGRGHLSFQPGLQPTQPGQAHCLPVPTAAPRSEGEGWTPAIVWTPSPAGIRCRLFGYWLVEGSSGAGQVACPPSYQIPSPQQWGCGCTIPIWDSAPNAQGRHPSYRAGRLCRRGTWK